MQKKKSTMTQAYKAMEAMESPAHKKKEMAMAKKAMHYLPNGKKYMGATHKMDGKPYSGAKHSASSKALKNSKPKKK